MIRLENSPEKSRCLNEGSSPVLKLDAVGKGQLVVDAGIIDAKRGRKKRLPTISWAKLSLRQARPQMTYRHENSLHVLSGERIQAANGRQVRVNGDGARAWACQVSDAVEPNHPFGLVTGHRDCGPRPVDGCPGVPHAANRAVAVVGAMLDGWIGLARLSLRLSRIGVTNDGHLQRIGGDAGGLACADRCENLHRQGNQDDRKKFPQCRRVSESTFFNTAN